jgi:transcriptional regulator with XRE-family HTH domain
MAEAIPFEELRKRVGFKLTKLAREAGVSPSSIYRIEGGKKVSFELVQSVLLVINKKLDMNYTISDLSGLNLGD